MSFFFFFISSSRSSSHTQTHQPVYIDPEETMRECRFQERKSQSCPNLFMDDDDDEEEERIIPNIKYRERAFSECIKPNQSRRHRSMSSMTLNRVQSDTDLSYIDRQKTFADSARGTGVMPGDLLAKIVVALGGYRVGDEEEQRQASIHSSVMGIHGFTDSQILASERNFDSDWSIAGSEKSYGSKISSRMRAKSEVRIPIDESVKVANLLISTLNDRQMERRERFVAKHLLQ